MIKLYVTQNPNPTVMYYNSLQDVLAMGEKVSPRGKSVLELRPACLEFLNPYNRVTFLGKRRINPFFQVAESLWILSGRADVEWLKQFNSNMGQFSDDGKWFNAPYGERMRSWNKNSLHQIVINPIDQLTDAYVKLTTDPNTRQAVISLYNPMFDNSRYTVNEHGKDTACNLCFTFKIRGNKLHMTVFNRSNDIHWGVFGANLCQFTTIQEVMLNWLRKSGVSELENLQMGIYYQVTDSLHVYLDDYGSKITDDIRQFYRFKDNHSTLKIQFQFLLEPRMSLDMATFDTFLSTFWGVLNPYLMDDDIILDESQRNSIFGKAPESLLSDLVKNKIVDPYWEFVIQSMLAYRLAKIGHTDIAMEVMNWMEPCQWKLSMLHFFKPFIKKLAKENDDVRYQKATKLFVEAVKNLSENLSSPSEESTEWLARYLSFEE